MNTLNEYFDLKINTFEEETEKPKTGFEHH